MNDIIGLPDEWRNYRGDYTDDELTEYGKIRVDVYESLADELEAALPKWTKITDDADTWPEEGEHVLTVCGFSWFYGDHFKAWIGDYWRPLCSLDTPPRTNHE